MWRTPREQGILTPAIPLKQGYSWLYFPQLLEQSGNGCGDREDAMIGKTYGGGVLVLCLLVGVASGWFARSMTTGNPERYQLQPIRDGFSSYKLDRRSGRVWLVLPGVEKEITGTSAAKPGALTATPEQNDPLAGMPPYINDGRKDPAGR
jgi:hypothetical protein